MHAIRSSLKVVSTSVIQHLRTQIRTVKYLSQREAIELDCELRKYSKFTLDQLTELGGWSCANAVGKIYSKQHLKLFGYDTVVYDPKKKCTPLIKGLVHQCTSMCIPFLKALPTYFAINCYGVIVDAIFGVTYKPPMPCEFIEMLNMMKFANSPIASIPSGWDVEDGEPEEGGIKPEMLISLVAPKLCAKEFEGKYHYLGGRFVPPELNEEYELCLPEYPGTDPVVRLD